jgi:hypothetical protein
MDSNIKARIFSAGVILVVSVLMVVMLYDTGFKPSYGRVLLGKKGVFTKAVVVGAIAEPTATAQYEFQVNGELFTGGYAIENKPEPVRFDTISIIYLPENPNINSIREEMDGWLIRFISFFIR